MNEQTQKVEPGKLVELGYDLFTIDEDGRQTLVHQTDMTDPERIVFGVTQGVIEDLEKAVRGLKAGDDFDITVKAADAFGLRNEEHVMTLDREIFVVDGKFDDEMIKKGNAVPMMTADGFRMMGLVVEVTPEKVVMDFNHPLAGKDVRFKGKVTLVRDATEEELHPQSCCGGGCGGDCGGDCNCDSEKGCGCQGCN